ncbi:MAG TPA: ABC transporter substrate-binding protein [Dehalococcoidia bacterium]|nr:ABC transporter substrate-binding protein [Dehalococcoidia bacterium]
MLAASSAGTLAAAITAACGPPPGAATPSPVPGLLSLPEDSTARARPGGALKSAALADVPSFDPHSAQSTAVHTQVAAYTYPRLLKFATARHPDLARGDVEGDLAESFEFSADKLQLTFRLRQGLRWDLKPPVNGRVIDAQDVVASWNRFLKLSPYRGDIAYDAAAAPAAPVESLTSPDSRTVVVKLKQPDAGITALFASDRLFYVLPREADAGFDPRYELRGYGPYRLGENRAATFRSWVRNPDYHVKGRPFIDSIELPIFGGYAARLAQFKAGNIWTHVASQGDIVSVKKELPALLLRKAEHYATNPSSLAFGYADNSPWKDERLRQAVSMLLDRETMIDVQTRRGHFWAEGLPFDVRYHTAVGAGWEGYWLDPRSDTFGPNGQYYRFSPDEAKKLIAAAGFENGLDSVLHYSGGLQYGASYARTAELVSGMLAAGGIRVRLEAHDYASDWLPNYHYAYAAGRNGGRAGKGFSGIAYRAAASYPHAAHQLFAQMHRDGAHFEGMTPDGRNPEAGDPQVNAALVTLRREFELRRQQELAQDFARLMAKLAYVIPNVPYAALGFTLTWPALANLGAYHGWPAGSAITEANLHLWIDTSKPPLGPG